MDVNFKKFASDAGTLFNRAKQYTEEKLGQAEKTELDAHFENLLQRADKTRMWADKLVKQTEAVLQPNPNVRMEEYLYDKLDKKKRERLTNVEILGQSMIDAGNDFGPGTSYGNALVKCGQTQQKLGLAERDLMNASSTNFLQPLRAFLDGDMKTVQKERKILETKRLDLDACKNRLRKAKSQNSKDQDDEGVAKAEADLRVAQAEFDRQAEITKLLLEGISSTHAHHLRCLNDLIEAQMTYYAQCQQYMSDLQRQLGSYTVSSAQNSLGGGSTSPTIQNPMYPSMPSGTTSARVTPSAPPATNTDNSAPSSGSHKARVLYDYDAADMKELSLLADEVITVYPLPGADLDWMMGERENQRGKVHITYLELLD